MISVIVPTFNRGKVITKSIDSILKQTYRDFELIVVDDGSTDNTEEVVKGYCDERIRYIRNDSNNHGPSKARNLGIIESKGEYIAFNDSDDEWHVDKLEKQFVHLQRENADVTFCVMRKNCGNKEQFIPDSGFTQDKCNMANILRGSFTGTPALFGKAEVFKQNYFDEKMRCNEDWDLVIRLIEKYVVAYQNENFVEVAVTEKSVSSDCENAIVAMKYILEKYSSQYEENYKSKKRMLKAIEYQKILSRDIFLKASLEKKITIKLQVLWLLCRIERYSYAMYFCLWR